LRKLVVYTVLTGDGELLADPLKGLESTETDLDISFICFSDSFRPGIGPWQVKTFDTLKLPPRTSSRLPKALPHRLLQDFDLSLYVDNTVTFKRLPTSGDLLSDNDYVYRLFRHSGRKALVEEFLAVAALNYDSPERIIEMIDSYWEKDGTLGINPVSTCTCLLREHKHPKVVLHGEMWWSHILRFSQRDQLSFDFCRVSVGLSISYFEGTKHQNDLFYPQMNAAPGRRLASDTSLIRRTKALNSQVTSVDDLERRLKADSVTLNRVLLFLTKSPLSPDINAFSNFHQYISVLSNSLEADKQISVCLPESYLDTYEDVSLLNYGLQNLGSVHIIRVENVDSLLFESTKIILILPFICLDHWESVIRRLVSFPASQRVNLFSFGFPSLTEELLPINLGLKALLSHGYLVRQLSSRQVTANEFFFEIGI